MLEAVVKKVFQLGSDHGRIVVADNPVAVKLVLDLIR